MPLHARITYRTWKLWVTDKSNNGVYCMSKDKKSGALLDNETEILIKDKEYYVLPEVSTH